MALRFGNWKLAEKKSKHNECCDFMLPDSQTYFVNILIFDLFFFWCPMQTMEKLSKMPQSTARFDLIDLLTNKKNIFGRSIIFFLFVAGTEMGNDFIQWLPLFLPYSFPTRLCHLSLPSPPLLSPPPLLPHSPPLPFPLLSNQLDHGLRPLHTSLRGINDDPDFV